MGFTCLEVGFTAWAPCAGFGLAEPDFPRCGLPGLGLSWVGAKSWSGVGIKRGS